MAPGKTAVRAAPSLEVARLRARLAEAEETLRAIRSGEVDTVVVAGKLGRQVFTLEGAERAYRVLIESMNEGAITLTADETILYANNCFAQMVKCPLEQLMGSSLRRFLSAEDRATLRPLMKRAAPAGSKIQVRLNCADGSKLAGQISLRPLGKNAKGGAAISMVVTDLTEARRTEERLRTLTHRVVQAQEDERGRVALELHDHITQLLVAIGLRSQVLVNALASRRDPLRREAGKLRTLLGQAAAEVERISRNLRPSILEQLGLVAILRETSTEFAQRTGVSVKLTCVNLDSRQPAETELTLYRILQEALQNVEKHAHARHVSVNLSQAGAFVQLTIKDDGVGFAVDQSRAARRKKGGIGLLGMEERAVYVHGVLTVKSAHRAGTEITVRIPLVASASSPRPFASVGDSNTTVRGEIPVDSRNVKIPPRRQITVLLADASPIVRQGLHQLLNLSGDFMIVGLAGTGREAVEKAQTFLPDVILMDIAIPGINGVEATRQILAANPASKVVIFSVHSDGAYIESLRAAGAVGFLEKQRSPDRLAKALRQVARGETFFSPIHRQAFASSSQLSPCAAPC